MEKNIDHYKQSAWHGKPYNFFGDYLLDKYSTRVLKLPIDSHLSCPNRDGTLDTDGCIFCCENGSASPTAAISENIHEQMDFARKSFRRSDRETVYIAYLQAYTNTHAPVSLLKEIYDTAVSYPDIRGLMIGTRPDCLSEKVLNLIESYKKENFELWVELGMQTIHEKSLILLNRRHSNQTTEDAIKRCSGRGIPVCVHVILGIPGETWNDMMKTAERISELPVNGVKIHHLHIIKDTLLEKLYIEKPFHVFTLKEYTSTVCDFMERLRPDIIIHRLMGDRNEDTLTAPAWGMHKGTVLNSIEDEFRKRCTWQGFLVEKEY